VPTFGGLHHMLNLCRGLVGECKVRRHTYPLDFKLDALDCYHGNSECHGNQRAVASKFGVHRRQIQKWLQQETQLRQRSTSAHVLNMFR
jgi:transposase-like protein